ncbi:T9SS type A sorting domain-containing protein, partial [Crocinitomix catalasitica]|nr:T9SS type A sorting domain-containing protein [Crocinitomix catalasitica]
GGSMGNLTVKMKHTSATDIYDFDNAGWTTVYQLNTNFLTTGLNTLNLTYPFTYDGTSDLIIELSFENITATGTDNDLNGTTTSNTSVVYTNERLGYLDVNNGEYALADLSNYDFDNEITISFWANGDAASLPVNTSVIEAQDSVGSRLINIHFPWSNESIYWDCGEGTGYDRINQLATTAEYEDVWHHWAFTKNQLSGIMNIYMDGTLWLSGGSKTRVVGEVNKFVLGANRSEANNWFGKMDEFRVWDVELSSTDIAAWMNQKVTAAHPNYANLVLYYDFDNEAYVKDKSGNNRDAMLTNPGQIQFYTESMAGHSSTNIRPNVTFVQGTYTSTLDSTLVMDSVQLDPIDVLQYQVNGRKFTIVDIEDHYPVGYSYLYDYTGAKLDSTFYAADVTITNDSIFYYKEPYEVIERYEIGRYITPYGIGFTLGAQGFTYLYDVTDYESLLHGDVDLQCHNTQELIDIKFAFIEGTPPRDIISVEKLWNGNASYSYQSLDDDVNLSSTPVALDPAGKEFKVRTRITGHGQIGTMVACCEWGNAALGNEAGRDHELWIDGTKQFEWEIWQMEECGDNPNIGQGGTWPYAREGWCPGDIVEEHEFDITPYVTAGTTTNIDYGIEDVPASDPTQGNGNYVIAMHLVTYGAPNFTNDAAIVDVLNPNRWEYYQKWNPTCQNPRVILKNTGSETLTSATIHIWVGGFDNVVEYNWTGSLNFLEEETVEIPITDGFWYEYANTFKFSARVTFPNGVPDEYLQNSTKEVYFDAPKAITEPFYVWLKTNNKASENYIWIKNQDGDKVYERTVMTNSTEYKDTLDLPQGCYTMEIFDTDHDGLGFWYSAAVEGETNGWLRLRKVAGGTIKTFVNDWGHYLSYSFTIGFGVGIDEEEVNYDFNVYPNPTEGIVNLSLDNFTGDQIQLNIYSELGQLIYTEDIYDNNPEGYWNRTVDLSHVPSGIYLFNVTSDDQTATKRIVVE